MVVARSTVKWSAAAHRTMHRAEPWMNVSRARREASGGRWARIGETPIGKRLYRRCFKDTSRRPGHHIGNIHLKHNSKEQQVTIQSCKFCNWLNVVANNE